MLVETLPLEFPILLLVIRLCIDSPPSLSPRSNSELNWDPWRNSTDSSVAHASELIRNQSHQILVVCVQCRHGVLRRHHRTTFMMRTESDLLFLLTVTNGLRIWFDHGRRNRICIFFRTLFHRFDLLLLLSFKNVSFKSLSLRRLLSLCDSDHSS